MPSSTQRSEAALQMDPLLRDFLETEVLPGLDVDAHRFFDGLGNALRRHTPRIASLLAERDQLQLEIDRWHVDHAGPGELDDYQSMLRRIGYIVDAPPPFQIENGSIDGEIASTNGAQLVVPVTNARYLLNAVNARWGSLYDALYGTDALGTAPPAGPYDPARGARVVAWTRRFLDDVLPLAGGSHADVGAFRIVGGQVEADIADGRTVGLVDHGAFVGFTGAADSPTGILFRHHGLGVEVRIDRDHPIGAADPAGVVDVVLEAATTTIVDFEDSVACVDAADKVSAYRNWLGLMTGTLRSQFTKGTATIERTASPNRHIVAPDGTPTTIRSRSLLLARVVGDHMSTDMVTIGGQVVPEGIIDAFVISAIALHDRRRPSDERNSKTGAIYLVKPKLHGPREVAEICELAGSVESALAIEPNTIKLGIMDEERRTSVNLAACIRAASSRITFVNTGFLDRTGDEIHTSMRAGPTVRKADMRSATWIHAYEQANVAVALRAGFRGRAQIGKGMWPAPDRMHDMLEQKLAHPAAGASCAWVPSPTAATLHATHYHRVDVDDVQRQLLATGDTQSLADLLTIAIADADGLTPSAIEEELENNLQGILGYVVRWVDQGVGCSKVPDVHDVALMEDRATCRISSQHVANWLLHGVITARQVDAALEKMAAVVDRQNAGDPAYVPMGPAFDGPAFCAARSLVFDGCSAPSGYTESVLHARRRDAKSR